MEQDDAKHTEHDDAPMESVSGFPLRLDGAARYEGTDLEVADGDLVLRNHEIGLVRGPQALGQSIAIALAYFTADLHMSEDDFRELRARRSFENKPRPEVDFGAPDWLEQQAVQSKWELFHLDESEHNPWRVPDMRDEDLTARVRKAIEPVREYLAGIHDVRSNGRDLELDIEPFGYETHVLRINNLLRPPASVQDALPHLRWKACTPIRRNDLLSVATVDGRLMRHLQAHPELLHELHWRKFEEVVAVLLEEQGWNVHVTRPSKDDGVDIFATLPHQLGSTLAVVDCKKWSKPLGVGMVRAIAGLRAQHDVHVGVLVTNSYFTGPARDLAENQLKRQVSLKDFDALRGWLDHHDWSLTEEGLLVRRAELPAKVT